MPQIIKLTQQRVVYVSCNPTTLAQVAMLDMFPHTGHLESMALFLHRYGKAARSGKAAL